MNPRRSLLLLAFAACSISTASSASTDLAPIGVEHCMKSAPDGVARLRATPSGTARTLGLISNGDCGIYVAKTAKRVGKYVLVTDASSGDGWLVAAWMIPASSRMAQLTCDGVVVTVPQADSADGCPSPAKVAEKEAWKALGTCRNGGTVIDGKPLCIPDNAHWVNCNGRMQLIEVQGACTSAATIAPPATNASARSTLPPVVCELRSTRINAQNGLAKAKAGFAAIRHFGYPEAQEQTTYWSGQIGYWTALLRESEARPLCAL
jgi:hypothetical protein